jgi:antibiotic biosynthesis monooxygenase (ABM) superfamily enzyme
MASENSEIVTFIISHHVRDDSIEVYENWLKEISAVCQSYAGNLGTNIIRPSGSDTKYTIIIRFAQYDFLKKWTDSEDRKNYIQKVRPYLKNDDTFQVKTGLDFWFTPESVEAKIPNPFKQFLVTLSAIYPLTIVVPWGWELLFDKVPSLKVLFLENFIISVTITALMVYVIMPTYTRLIHRWLFK